MSNPPNFPGIARPRPAPPKYIVQADGTILQLSNIQGPKKLEKTDPACSPIAAKISTIIPEKKFDAPPHRYRESVNSRTQFKMDQSALVGPPVREVGSTFTHLPNATRVSFTPQPKNVTIPRAFIPPPRSAFQDSSLLHNRTADGTILGSHQRRFVDAQHVPSLDVAAHEQMKQTLGYNVSNIEKLVSSVGPNNPTQLVVNNWYACWDEAAQAIYYYNGDTGEATWVRPQEFENGI